MTTKVWLPRRFARKKMQGDKPANMVRLRTKTEAFVDMGY